MHTHTHSPEERMRCQTLSLQKTNLLRPLPLPAQPQLASAMPAELWRAARGGLSDTTDVAKLSSGTSNQAGTWTAACRIASRPEVESSTLSPPVCDAKVAGNAIPSYRGPRWMPRYCYSVFVQARTQQAGQLKPGDLKPAAMECSHPCQKWTRSSYMHSAHVSYEYSCLYVPVYMYACMLVLPVCL